jgi:predicted nuclease with TOPRIM domain
MKTTLSIIAASLVVSGAALAQGTNAPGSGVPGKELGDHIRQGVQDCIQISEPKQLKECLPGEIKGIVDDMVRAREQHQQQLAAAKKEIAGCTDEEREQLREQLREQIRELARDREQLRERLRELRECLPSHQELMEQARERARERRGGE